MEQTTADTLYQVMIGVIIPVFVSRMKKVSWPSHYKFAVAFALAIAASAIVPIAKLLAGNDFSFSELLSALTVIFTTSQVAYQGIFKMLNAEEMFNPRAVLLSIAKEKVADYVELIEHSEILNLLDPQSTQALSIQIHQFSDPDEPTES